MRRTLLQLLCGLAWPSLCCPQTASRLSPEVRAFVKEDAPVVALKHVRVIDGTGAAPRADQTLVIADGKITAMGEFANTKIPDGARVLDLTGRTVIPGLVGMHDHMYYTSPGGPPPLYPEHAASFPRLYLAAGVTAIRTTGSVEPYSDLELKHAIDDGKMAGPKIHDRFGPHGIRRRDRGIRGPARGGIACGSRLHARGSHSHRHLQWRGISRGIG